MNKGELTEKVAAEVGGSKSEAGRYTDAVLKAIEDELRRGGEVQIAGFGKFGVSERPAREGVNPSTGQKMQISASRVPKFSAGTTLKHAVNA